MDESSSKFLGNQTRGGRQKCEQRASEGQWRHQETARTEQKIESKGNFKSQIWSLLTFLLRGHSNNKWQLLGLF